MPATRSIFVGVSRFLKYCDFVNENVIDAEFIKDQAVVFLVLGQQVFQLVLRGGFLFLDGLDEIAVGTFGPGVLSTSSWSYSAICSQQELLLVVARHADALEASCG